MKFHQLVACTVTAFVLVSSVSCARQRTHMMTYIDRGKKGWLGVEVQDVTKRLKEKKHVTVDAGAYVSEVVEDSPAEEAGIKEGDVIVKLDDKTIDDSNDLTKVVQRIKPKTEVKVEIVRNSEKKTLTAKIGRSSAPRAFAYGFGDEHMPMPPHMPSMPKMGFQFFSQQENGLSVQSMSKQLADFFEVPDKEGLLVTNVEKGSSAEKAGFKAGDVLTKIDNERVNGMDDLREALRDNEGKEVKCDVIRKGKSTTITWHIEKDDDGDEDDDDVSFNSVTPYMAPHIRPFRMGPLHLPNLDYLKEELRDMKRELRENILELRRNLRDEFAL